MNLPVAVSMQQHKIIHRIFSSIRLPLNMVEVPTRFLGDLLRADTTDPFLLKPKAK
jgi:hypothetical protein